MPRTAIQIQKAVIFALFVRELKTRFGQYRLSYFWVVLEPVAHVVVLSIVWTVLGREEFAGIPVPFFLMTGIVPFLFFQRTATQCMNAFRANQGLFTYRQVRPADTVVSRILLEATIYFSSYLFLIFIGGWFLGYEVSIHNVLGLVAINSVLFILTFGLSLIFMVYGALYPEAMKLVPIFIFRPMYFTSGILFPLFIVPAEYHELLLYNPILHVIELNHAFYFRAFESPEVSIFYVFMTALILTAFGLLSYRANWMKMIAT